jgi:hypothetical protein
MAEDEYNFDYRSIASDGMLTEAGSDALANKVQLVISFHHVPSKKSVFFKAFITSFTDTYAPDWAAETVYGRADPIYLFKNTTRKISLAFKVPAASSGEAYENLSRVQQLVQFLYPTYTDVNNANTISQSPLVRLKVMNLARDASTGPQKEAEHTAENIIAQDEGASYSSYSSTADSSRGLLGVINNVTVNHNLESDAGVIEKSQNTILPKLMEINLDFSPIHEHAVGWRAGNSLDFASPGFPYMGHEELVLGEAGWTGDTDPTSTLKTSSEFNPEQIDAEMMTEEEIAQATAAFEPGTEEDANIANAEGVSGTVFGVDESDIDEIELHEDDGLDIWGNPRGSDG